MILPIDWKKFRKDSDERFQEYVARTKDEQAQVRVVNQGRDAADTELVRFIVANYPVTLFRGLSEARQDELVDELAAHHGFSFYRTGPVRKQVAYRFQTAKR